MNSDESRIERMEERMSLLGFPDEIIEKIFFDLDFADRCQVRGLNKRLYGIEGRMNKLENRKKLQLIGEDRTSSNLNMIIRNRKEKVSLDEAFLLIRRFANIFKFKTVVFSPSQKEHMKLLDELNEVYTDLFKISEWEFPNQPIHYFDVSTICNVMQKADVLKIVRICATVKPEDLLLINEIAQANANFCGISIRISRKTARDFVKNILGEGDKINVATWIVQRNEGRLEMTVRRNHRNVHKFGLYNTECEEKYPMLRSNDLFENSEYESEESEEESEESEDDDDEICDDDSYDSYDDCFCHGYANCNRSDDLYPNY